MLLNFMGKNTLDWFDAKCFTSFTNIFGNLLICCTNLDGSCGSEERVPGGFKNISLLLLGFTSDDESGSRIGSVTIDVATQFNRD